MDADSALMTFRPMSQMLRFYVIPEIDARVAAGTLAAADLPFQVTQFRFLQTAGRNVIEINDDVRITATLRVNRAVAAEERLTSADVDPDECFLEPPEIDGIPAAFFLCRSSFLNFITLFDFTPNAPRDPGVELSERIPMSYPLAEMAHADQLRAVMGPIVRYKELADANWPPGPGHYPHVLWHLHKDPTAPTAPAFSNIVAAAYNETYWRQQVGFWEATAFFGDRFTYVKKAVEEYLADDYVSSIYVLVPHFEGIVKDYLAANGVPPRYRFESCVADLKLLVLSRRVMMFPRPVLDQIFAFIETGTFLAETGDISDPTRQVTRHGIAHGVFKNFENRDIALKYLILLDALSYVLLHDKLLAGTL